MYRKTLLKAISRSIPSRCASMLPFEKYSEFDTIKDSQFNDMISSSQEWIAEEKVNGANFSIHIFNKGSEVKFAKRSGFIGEHEFFFGYTKLLPDFNRQIPFFFSAMNEKFTGVDSIIVYGELFGGKFVHPEIPQEERFTQFKGQQRRISPIIGDFFPQYSPDIHFYAYDIKYRKGSSKPWILLSPDESRNIFRTVPELLYARELFRGNMKKCMAFDLDKFETLIPHFLGLGDYVIPANIAEGVVLKSPSRSGEALHVTKSSILKFKHRAFQEARHKDTAKKGMSVEAERPKYIQKMGETVIDAKQVLSYGEMELLDSLVSMFNEEAWNSVCITRQEQIGKKFEKTCEAVSALAEYTLKKWMSSAEASNETVMKFTHSMKRFFVMWATNTAENYVRSIWRTYTKKSP